MQMHLINRDSRLVRTTVIYLTAACNAPATRRAMMAMVYILEKYWTLDIIWIICEIRPATNWLQTKLNCFYIKWIIFWCGAVVHCAAGPVQLQFLFNSLLSALTHQSADPELMLMLGARQSRDIRDPIDTMNGTVRFGIVLTCASMQLLSCSICSQHHVINRSCTSGFPPN